MSSHPLQGHEQEVGDDEYATPPKVWRPIADSVNGFDLDPASGAESVPIADTRLTPSDDGLSLPWHGDVWLNPPWSSEGTGSTKERWLRKAVREEHRDAVDTITVCLPAETSAHWWHDYVMDASVVCLIGPGRIPFEGQNRNPSFALSLSIYGDPSREHVEAVGQFGTLVVRVDDETERPSLSDFAE